MTTLEAVLLAIIAYMAIMGIYEKWQANKRMKELLDRIMARNLGEFKAATKDPLPPVKKSPQEIAIEQALANDGLDEGGEII